MNMLKQLIPYIAAVIVLVLLYSLWGYPLLRKQNEALNLLEEKKNALNGIYSSSLGPPSAKLIADMEEDNKQLIDKYIKLREKLPVAKTISIPEGENLPLFYLEELRKIKERLRTEAAGKDIEILSENFGLPNVLPTEEEALNLIKRLYAIELIGDLLIEIGVNSIDSVEWEEDVIESERTGRAGETRASSSGGRRPPDIYREGNAGRSVEVKAQEVKAEGIYEEIPLTLAVTCDMLSLTNLLFTLENADKGFFIINNFSFFSSIEDKEVVEEPSFSARPGDRRYPPTVSRSERQIERERRIQTVLELSVIRWKSL